VVGGKLHGDYLIVLGRRIVFERREDAALAMVTFC
jgi:hypothetical protein